MAEEYIVHGPRDDSPVPRVALGDYLLRNIRRHGDSVAQVYPDIGESYTFAEILRRGVSLAEELQARGVLPGDVVSVVTRVTPHFPPLLLATQLVGAVTFLLNQALDFGDMKTMLSLVQPKIVFCEPVAASLVQKILPHLDPCPDVIVLDQDPAWRNAIGRPPNSDFKPVQIPDFENRDAIILCSSGTTGLSKGVILTHRSTVSQLHVFESDHLKDIFRSDDTVLQFSAHFWISGLFLQLFSLSKGSKLVVISDLSVEKYIRVIDEYKVTNAFITPNLAIAVSRSPVLSQCDISNLRVITCSGAAMSGDTQKKVESVLNKKLCQWFSMTEMLVALGSIPGDNASEGSSGRVQPNVKAKVLDEETGLTVGPMKRGELCLKGPGLTKGYFRNPEATAAAIDADGWFHTGDVAYYDDDKCFYIVERIKDLIKYRGHHVVPVEIETLLLGHPGVKDAAVVGVKHELDQERPLAVVVLQPGAEVTERDLETLVSSNLAEHKWLRAGVKFVDSIPKTATGKTQRRIVRNQVNNELRTST